MEPFAASFAEKISGHCPTGDQIEKRNLLVPPITCVETARILCAEHFCNSVFETTAVGVTASPLQSSSTATTFCDVAMFRVGGDAVALRFRFPGAVTRVDFFKEIPPK